METDYFIAIIYKSSYCLVSKTYRWHGKVIFFMQGSGFQAMVSEFGEIELFWILAPTTLIYSELTMAEKIRSHVTPWGKFM